MDFGLVEDKWQNARNLNRGILPVWVLDRSALVMLCVGVGQGVVLELLAV